MSLLSICQAACATAPTAVPVQIIGSTDETAVLLLGLANDAGEDIARRPPGGWVSMIREYDFRSVAIPPQSGTIANNGNSCVISGLTGINLVQPGNWIASGTGIAYNTPVMSVTSSTVTLPVNSTVTGAGKFSFGQSDYPLPGDFERAIDNTFWDRSRFWSMRGPQSPQQWQLYKSSVIGRATIQRRYRFRSIFANGAMGIGGVGAGVGQIGGGPRYQTWLSIDPVPFDNGAQFVFEYVSNGWCISAAGLPQNSWQADTDIGVIDEYLLRLSVKWRLLRRLGLSYNEELDEFERQMDKAIAHDGAAPILSLTPSDHLSLIGPWNLPETGYGNVTS